MTDEPPFKYWNQALAAAARSDSHTVELVGTDRGMHVEIDGVRMFDGHGYPIESFTLTTGSGYTQWLTDDGLEKLNQLKETSDRSAGDEIDD